MHHARRYSHRLFFIGDDAGSPAVLVRNVVLKGGTVDAGAGLGGAVVIFDGGAMIDTNMFGAGGTGSNSNNLAALPGTSDG